MKIDRRAPQEGQRRAKRLATVNPDATKWRSGIHTPGDFAMEMQGLGIPG
jgi:hypothetical protein